MRYLAVAFVVLASTGCSVVDVIRAALDPRVARAQVAEAAQTEMIGMSAKQVLACMGPPVSQASAGNTDAWSYYSSSNVAVGTVQPVLPGQAATVTASQGYCTTTVTMTNGRVSQLSYQGYTGGILARNQQCGYAVARCVQ